MTPNVTVSRANPVANRFDNPRIGHRVTAPAGVGGVYHAMEKAIPNYGLVPLLKMNQHGGVDCPGCAWPEPGQGDINFVEFCENGAKAIAQETTSKRVSREFFANTTVRQVREMPD